MVSLISPLAFLFIFNRTIAAIVIMAGIFISLIAVFYPVTTKHTSINRNQLDCILPFYCSKEYHKIEVKAPIENIKKTLVNIELKDVTVIKLLFKIGGIKNNKIIDNVNISTFEKQEGVNIVSTPDFNFFEVSPNEWITVIILKTPSLSKNKNNSPPTKISNLEEFIKFNQSGYVKIATNLYFTALEDDTSVISTETRNYGITQTDCRLFNYYWRIIYPGSAIIREAWLNRVKKISEKTNKAPTINH